MAEGGALAPAILHHDTHLFIVAKPAGMPTTSPASGRPCLVDWAKSELSGHPFIHPTSRLDAPVTGVVTFALTRLANEHLREARNANTYSREYFGVTVAPVSFEQATWDWPIAIDPQDKRLRVAGSGRGQKDACSVCTVAERGAAGTLLCLVPKTGRTHQLRVHASRAGVPLFGDHAYGGARRCVLQTGEVVPAPRVMLHCSSVGFPGVDGGTVRIEAPLPEDFSQTWGRLLGEV
ncbi:MAG: RNA pseudouridine synthase [Myxococcota bacterium]